MNLSGSLCIKILSLAVVVWAVLSHPGLTAQNASWVPWVVLVLLILLEAYATDTRPAAWSLCSAGLLRVVGPGMLPYYAILGVILACGPGQVRPISPTDKSTYPAPPFGWPRGLPNRTPGGLPTPGPPAGFPGNTLPPRPTILNPAAGQPGANATGAPPRPSTFPGPPVNGGPALAPIQPATGATAPANGAVAPTSTAQPPVTPAK